MRKTTPPSRLSAAGAVLVLAVGLTGCAHVKQEDLDNRLAALREDVSEEIAQGDRQVRDDLNGRIDGVEQRLNALADDLDALERDFDATVERLETALRFDLPVHFGFDQDQLRDQDKPVLDRFAQVVAEYYPDALITVEGFTDPAGSEEYNMRLGKRRAESVKSYLVGETSLPEGRLRTVSYGESSARQVAEGEYGPGQNGWQNRRVVLVVDHGGAAPVSGTVTSQASEVQTSSSGGR